jgi:Protein of unknown function (DUF1553)/Protein of unknown function (DUF1549)
MTRRLNRAAFVSLLVLAAGGSLCAQPVRPERPAVPPGEHWAFRQVVRPDVPTVRDRAWERTPIDAFILRRLEKAGLRPAPPADRRTLLRRVYLDLIGLPPTTDEQRAFLTDLSPDAFARVVDDLLSRPQYGERWGRHWLDVVRYAETNGYERDGAKPSAWRYRDYVIDSFNRDKPFDRFVIEQLAGDEVEGSSAETQIATTFLRLGTWDDEPADPTVDRYEQLDDVLGTTATAFLALTLRCARCHDHKFEPFPQTDYYKMLAVFEPLKRPQADRKDLDLPVGSAEELAAFRADPKTAPRGYVWKEEGTKPPVTHVLRRGDPKRPREEVGPGLPAILVRREPEPPKPTAKSTGRRLWLARWLASPDNPLTARVMVNRVWQGHFGRGLVPTANDFGTAGEPPTNPELLDWLAARFVADGWRLKPLHRMIVLSNVYQTAATASEEAIRADPKNTLLGRWRQRRLEAEAVRDSMLAVSGRLNREQHGPSVYPTLARAVLEGQSRPGDGWGKSDERQQARRSVYVFVKRSLAVPELDLLDAPDTTSSCEARPVSTTAPQALTFLNGAFANEQASHFAARLRREAGADPAAQVRRAFELALCRTPRDEELTASVAFLGRQRLEEFCLVMLNLNEFVYLD